ncbi:Rv3235 family protein [Demequina aurantiaca]|uniref:Rv3235 family protein n=1 Tax=Demequina aurantiaca TaxID=676200 RepID=UPI003D3320A2
MTAMRAVGAPARLAVGSQSPALLVSAQSDTATPTRAPSRESLYARGHEPLGDPAPLACTVAKAALETVLGAMTINPLVRWLAPEVRERLAQQHSLARRAGNVSAPTVSIKRARVCRVSARAAEVSIVAYCDGHARAIAMRLEDVTGRWLITVLEVG